LARGAHLLQRFTAQLSTAKQSAPFLLSRNLWEGRHVAHLTIMGMTEMTTAEWRVTRKTTTAILARH